MKRKRKRQKVYFLWVLPILLSVVMLPKVWSTAGAFVLPFLDQALQKIAITSLMIDSPKGSLEILKRRYEREDKEFPLVQSSTPEEASSQVEVVQNPQSSLAPLPPAVETAPSSQQASLPTVPKPPPPEIPEEYRGTILEERYTGDNSPAYVNLNKGYVRNYTELSNEKLAKIAQGKPKLSLKDTQEPQVLIIHTHATESYEPYDRNTYDTRGSWRSVDNNQNMTAVGEILAQELEKQGIGVIQSKEQHDYPSYSGSYTRSAKTVEEYLKKYPSIKVVLDIHRDAVERDNNVIVKAVQEIDGEKAAQVMVVVGSDDGSNNLKNWEENFKLAAEITRTVEEKHPGLTRPIYLSYGKYNMDLSPGLVILEFGTHANTLEEAKRSAKYVGEAVAELLNSYKTQENQK